MKTEVSNGKNVVTIERGKPSVVIGEKCSSVGFKKIKEAVEKGDYNILVEEAKLQVNAGAQILDVCVIGQNIDEIKVLPEVVKLISDEVNVPLAIEYGQPEALEAALDVYEGKPLVNSFNGENDKIERVLPILKKYKPAVIVLPIDNQHGIPKEADIRIKVAKNVINLLVNEGLTREDIIVDCLVTTIATDTAQVMEQFNTLRRIRDELGLNATAGASNVSFGLPGREQINSHFLSSAITYGLNVPITDPTKIELKEALLLGDLIAGNDEYAMNYIQYFRSKEQSA